MYDITIFYDSFVEGNRNYDVVVLISVHRCTLLLLVRGGIASPRIIPVTGPQNIKFSMSCEGAFICPMTTL